MKNILCIFLFSIAFFKVQAQHLAIGQWREHLPYNEGKEVVDAGTKIYCATNEGLFAYIKEDASIERFSKLNGLNDFGISTIAYQPDFNVLLIAYDDANIDFLYNDGSVFNLPFIKEKSITGLKNINNIYIKGKLAYLSCGFGIVVVDIERQEVKDTYYIGTNGTSRNVLAVTEDGNNIFAATDSGVYSASLSSPNLADFNYWNVIFADTANAGDFNMLATLNGKVYLNYAKPDATNTSTDELWIFENNVWSKVTNSQMPQQPKRIHLRVVNNNLVIINNVSVSVFDEQLNRIGYYDNTLYSNAQISDAVIETSSEVWIADLLKGLIKIENNKLSSIITPGGPFSNYVAQIAILDNKVWVAHGPKSTSWSPQEYPIDGFSLLADDSWKSWNKNNAPSLVTNKFIANMSIAVVPGQPEHIRLGSVTSGLLDYSANSFTYYNSSNSTLLPAVGNELQTKVHGIKHDEAGNLWVVNSGVKNVIHVLKTDNTWRTFDMQGVVSGTPFAGEIIIDQNNYKWVNLFGGGGSSSGTIGLVVLDDKGSIDNTADDRKKFIAMAAESTPRCLAIDLDGQIWVGTDAGPQIIYSPGSAFDGDVTPQKILIKQDNTYQYLLELESISTIAVDGANRKWIGTLSSGVYLLSADGQSQIYHFTAENSPLFSNNISTIAINPKTGEVFIGTDKGLISYQSDAIEGGDKCESVTVYPNPIRPGYNGPIAIKGVMDKATIKITDISGNVVYQGSALGGQAIWNGLNLKGEKAHTGVYLVFASDNDGVNACVTKLLFVR